MCQLTLIHTKNITVNGLLATFLMRENSKTNKDGCGIYNGKRGVVKTEKTASALPNLSEEFLNDKLDAGPLLCHVRAASATLAKKLLDEEHAHPFSSEHYVFAHNGTLSFKDKKMEDAYKDADLIDSQIFLAELEKAYTGNVVKDLTVTMELFRGKFAFLIFHKPTEQYFVVRGASALLHKADISIDGKPGVIVNTEFATLVDSLMYARNILMFFGMKMEAEVPKLLEAESIYILDKETFAITKVGDIKETPKETYVAGNFTPGWNGGRTSTAVTTANPSDSASDIKKIYTLCYDNGLSVFDLDEICNAMFGNGLIAMTRHELHKVLEFLKELVKRNNNGYIKIWKEMRRHRLPKHIYGMLPNLKFPYFLTDITEFRAMFKQFQEELAKFNEVVIDPK